MNRSVFAKSLSCFWNFLVYSCAFFRSCRRWGQSFIMCSKLNICMECPSCINSVLPFYDLNDDEFIDTLQFYKSDSYIDINDLESIFNRNNENGICNIDDFELQEEMNECKYYIEADFKHLSDSVNNDFSLLHFNARSLNKNFFEILEFISSLSFSFSVYGFSETWIHSQTPMLFNLEGYSFIHSDRIDGRGGGVALLVSNTLNFKIRNNICINHDGTEILFIEIVVQSGKNIIVGIVYRQPKSKIDNFIIEFDKCIQELSKENKLIYIMGDFNIDISKSTCKYSVIFLQVLYSSQLLPLIDKPTRLSARSATLIDNIFTNNIN